MKLETQYHDRDCQQQTAKIQNFRKNIRVSITLKRKDANEHANGFQFEAVPKDMFKRISKQELS